jgi:outer membrane lipoprotein LolB
VRFAQAGAPRRMTGRAFLPIGWCMALLVSLSACSTLAPPGQPPLQTAISGRMAVRVDPVEPGGTPRSSSGSFELLGTPAAGELRLSTSLGTTVAVARWRPGEVLLQADGQIRRYDDLDQLTRDMIGESLPVEALFDWLRGRPWPGSASESLPDGDAGFQQLGWRVSLAQAGEGLILASRSAPPVVTVRAKVDLH